MRLPAAPRLSRRNYALAKLTCVDRMGVGPAQATSTADAIVSRRFRMGEVSVMEVARAVSD